MLELDYPSDAFIAQFARTHRLTPADVLRDIARLVAIHQMTVETKFLSDNCVLCGGVAMRFYGSRRFTVTDTDASYRLDDWDELDLQAALDIEVEDLTIEAADPAYWQRKNRLTTAQPVEDIKVPVMDINEQLAEKILGWSVNGLAKHYLDCAWISGQMRAELSRETVIGYIGPSVTMSHARPAVRKHLIPLLWPDRSAAPAAPTQGGA